jgi:hypothetical protein
MKIPTMMSEVKLVHVRKNFTIHNISKTYTVGKYQHYLHGSGLLGSEKQWLWEFTCYRSEMLKHSSEKLNFISKKKEAK